MFWIDIDGTYGLLNGVTMDLLKLIRRRMIFYRGWIDCSKEIILFSLVSI